MLANPVLSLPPSCVKLCVDETSQHLLYQELDHAGNTEYMVVSYAPSVGVCP